MLAQCCQEENNLNMVHLWVVLFTVTNGTGGDLLPRVHLKNTLRSIIQHVNVFNLNTQQSHMIFPPWVMEVGPSAGGGPEPGALQLGSIESFYLLYFSSLKWYTTQSQLRTLESFTTWSSRFINHSSKMFYQQITWNVSLCEWGVVNSQSVLQLPNATDSIKYSTTEEIWTFMLQAEC